MIAPAFMEVLRRVYEQLNGRSVNWVITGSTGMALQGMPYQPHDLDLQTDEVGAYEIADALDEFVTQPVTERAGPTLRSFFARLQVDGVEVEVMGDMQHQLPDGSWSAPTCLSCYRRWILVDGMWLPVLSLAYEAQAYARLGRTEKAAVLQAWAAAHPEERLEEITNFRRLSPQLGTGGQPLASQIPAVAADGFTTWINLVPPDVDNALPDEARLVTAQGLEYLSIPVYWEQPTLENVRAYFAAMDARRGQKVFTHCTLNFRVSSFSFLYRTLRLGVPLETARADMLAVWQPNETWSRLMEAALQGG